MALDHGLGPAGGAAREQPDGGVIGVGRERLQLVGSGVHHFLKCGITDDEGVLEEPGSVGRLGKGVMGLGTNERRDRPGVAEEIGDGLGLELRVDHHYDRPDLQDAEQCRHVGRAVRERDDHPLFGGHAGLLKQMPESICHRLDVAVAQRALIRDQGTTVPQSLADAGVEKVMGDVERLGWREGHR